MAAALIAAVAGADVGPVSRPSLVSLAAPAPMRLSGSKPQDSAAPAAPQPQPQQQKPAETKADAAQHANAKTAAAAGAGPGAPPATARSSASTAAAAADAGAAAAGTTSSGSPAPAAAVPPARTASGSLLPPALAIERKSAPTIVGVVSVPAPVVAQRPMPARYTQLRTIKGGNLTKMGGGFKTWRERIFVLDGSLYLYYFVSLQDKSWKGVLSLQGCSVSEEPAVGHERNSACFSIQTLRSWNASKPFVNRKYYLCSDASAEVNDWMALIRRLCKPTD